MSTPYGPRGPLKETVPVNVTVRLKAVDLEAVELIRNALTTHTLNTATRSSATRHAIHLVAELLRGLQPGVLPDPAYVRSVARAMAQSGPVGV